MFADAGALPAGANALQQLPAHQKNYRRQREDSTGVLPVGGQKLCLQHATGSGRVLGCQYFLLLLLATNIAIGYWPCQSLRVPVVFTALLLALPLATGFWHCHWLLALLLASGIATGYWHCYWLLALLLATGIATGYWHCYWLLALLLAGIV